MTISAVMSSLIFFDRWVWIIFKFSSISCLFMSVVWLWWIRTVGLVRGRIVVERIVVKIIVVVAVWIVVFIVFIWIIDIIVFVPDSDEFAYDTHW